MLLRKASEEEKMLFAEHLSLMIKGGIPLSAALKTLKSEAKSSLFKRTLEDILNRVLEGESLSKAISNHPGTFDEFHQNIIKIGEKSGSLEENLRYLAMKLQKDNEMRKKVWTALIYPLIVVSFTLFIAFAITFFVLPKITNLFQLMKVDLPLTTRALILFVNFSTKYWSLILLILVTAIISLRALLRIKIFKLYLDKVTINLPFISHIFRSFNLTFLSRTFYILLKSGVPLNETLAILSETLPSEDYKKKITLIVFEIERGEKINQALGRFPKNFPTVFSEMILIGEESGTLEESLSYLADYYEKELDSILKNLSAILEPILLILVGAFAGFIAIAILTPIYKFIGELRFR